MSNRLPGVKFVEPDICSMGVNPMDLVQHIESLRQKFSRRVVTIDSHTAGEATRLILAGPDPVPGKTMQAKRAHCMAHWDHIRRQLTREPRGHRDTLAALVTPPTTAGAHFGLIYMDARRYPFLCGHATMGAVMTLIEMGVLKPSAAETEFIVDTPSGPMPARVTLKNGRVASVAIRMVPAFVYRPDETLVLAEMGSIRVATVCVGGFFAMVAADQIGIALTADNHPRLIEWGMRIIEAANQQLSVRHPLRPEVNSVDVTEFYDTGYQTPGRSKGIVIYGEAHMDRSPCGTGTAAKMTLLHHQGKLGLNEPFLNAGPLGTLFRGRLVEETRLGGIRAVVAEISGQAYITGIHEFVLDPADPFPEGFLL